jgi:hypothetical protein
MVTKFNKCMSKASTIILFIKMVRWEEQKLLIYKPRIRKLLTLIQKVENSKFECKKQIK